MTKAEELINKHLTKEGGTDLGIADGNIYKACLGAINEALPLAGVSDSRSSLQLPSREDVSKELTIQAGYLYGDEEYTDRRNYINGFTDAYRYIKQFTEEKQG